MAATCSSVHRLHRRRLRRPTPRPTSPIRLDTPPELQRTPNACPWQSVSSGGPSGPNVGSVASNAPRPRCTLPTPWPSPDPPRNRWSCLGRGGLRGHGESRSESLYPLATQTEPLATLRYQPESEDSRDRAAFHIALVLVPLVTILAILVGSTLILSQGLVLVILIMSPVLITRPDWLVTLLVASIPLGALGRIGSSGPGQVVDSMAQVIGAYVAFLWLLRTFAGRSRIRIPRPVRFLAGFVAIETIFLITHPHLSRGLYVNLRYYIPYFLLVVVLTNLITSRRLLRRALAAVVTSLTAIAAVSVLVGLGLLRISIPGLTQAVGGQGTFRVGALSGGLGTASFQYVFAMGIAIYFLRTSVSRRAQLLVTCSMVTLGVANIMTITIGGIIAMSLVIAAAYLASAKGLRTGNRVTGRNLVRLTFIGVATVTILATVYSHSEPFQRRVQNRLGSEIRDLPTYSWAGGRVGSWLGGVRLVADHPLTGVGAGNAAFVLPEYIRSYPGLLAAYYTNRSFKEGELYIDLHNTFIASVAEAGVVGGGFFLLAVISVLRAAWRSARSTTSKEWSLLGKCLTLGFMGGLSFALSTDLLTEKYLWLSFALVVAYASVSATTSEDAELDETLEPVPLMRGISSAAAIDLSDSAR